jgi:nitrogenase subunit NifH
MCVLQRKEEPQNKCSFQTEDFLFQNVSLLKSGPPSGAGCGGQVVAGGR